MTQDVMQGRAAAESLTRATLGANARRLREAKGASRRVAGEALGVDQTWLYEVEHGHSFPSLSLLVGMSLLYAAPLTAFFADVRK